MFTNTPCAPGRQRGLSLIELVLFIVIVSVAVTGLLSVMNLTAAHSADPLARKQALSVAEATLEEIEMVLPFGSVTSYNDPAKETKVVVPAGYAKTVVVTEESGFGLPALDPSVALRISVTVTYPGGSVVVEGYRTNYTFPPYTPPPP